MKEYRNNMNILITGGTGFLGSHLTKRLVNENKVESITILTTNVRQNTSLKSLGIDNHEKINLVKGDVRDFDFLRLLFVEYELVIHPYLYSTLYYKSHYLFCDVYV